VPKIKNIKFGNMKKTRRKYDAKFKAWVAIEACNKCPGMQSSMDGRDLYRGIDRNMQFK